MQQGSEAGGVNSGRRFEWKCVCVCRHIKPPFWPCNLFSSLQHVEKCAVTPSAERKCQNTPNQDKRMEIRGSVRHVSSLAWHGAVGFTLAAMGWGGKGGGGGFQNNSCTEKKEKVKFQIRSQRRTKAEM